MIRRMCSDKKNSYRCLFSTATREKKKARGKKMKIDGSTGKRRWGWWGSGGCLFPVRVQVYISVIQVKTLVSEKKTEKRQKQYLKVLFEAHLVEL
jgi:hypothetical protein